MNTISHFLAAYLIGRKLNLSKEKLFLITFFGILSDFDVPFFYLLMGFKNPSIYHAGITHTLLFGLIAAVIASFIFLVHDVRKKEGSYAIKPFLILFTCAMLGFVLHLAMDVITTANAYASFHHLYFWPLWNFSFHMEYMFIVPHTVIWIFQLFINFFIVGFLLHDYFIAEKRPWNLFINMDESKKHDKLDKLLMTIVMLFYVFWQASLMLKIFGIETLDLVSFILGIVT